MSSPNGRIHAVWNRTSLCRGEWMIAAVGVTLWAAGVSPGESAQQEYLKGPGAQADVSALARTAAGAKGELIARYPEAGTKLPDRLLVLLDLRERLGKAAAAEYANANRLPVQDDHVTAIVVPTKGIATQALAQALRAKGATVVRTGLGHIKATVPVPLLGTLVGEVNQIDHIRLPIAPKPVVVSEGVVKTNVDSWHACGAGGIRGAGARIAVIDGGYVGLSGAIGAGEIPAETVQVDLTGAGIETGTEHGVGVAEIVYDMAPDAQLHLIKIGDESDLESAGSYCTSNGIDIVNHSMGWYGFNFFDGAAYSSMTPSPVTIANDAGASGIVWVNAAGNDYQRHWRGPWADANANGSLEWTSGAEINQIGSLSAGTGVVLWLTWNAWPVTNQDYDLYLVRWRGNQWVAEAASENWQNGSQPPIEVIGVTVSQAAYYGVAVTKYSATGTHTFIVRSWYQHLQYTTSAGSIGCPADAASVTAAGAIDENVYTTGPIESYSSNGPTNGAYTGQTVLTKPDVCGPDATASWTYSTGFAGTSAASPHVAGLAALVLSMYPDYSRTDVISYLETHTIDLGSAGKDNTYGYGPVVLPVFSAPVITQHPGNQMVCQQACGGGAATFHVVATGTPPPTFQWRKDGQPIDGGTLDTLTIDPVLPDDLGIYDVEVTNTCGSTRSSSATLTCSAPADLTCDGDVDGFDFLTFSDCYNGSNMPPLPLCENPCADLDGDGDVDGFDFLTFSTCFNGSNNPPRCP